MKNEKACGAHAAMFTAVITARLITHPMHAACLVLIGGIRMQFTILVCLKRREEVSNYHSTLMAATAKQRQ